MSAGVSRPYPTEGDDGQPTEVQSRTMATPRGAPAPGSRYEIVVRGRIGGALLRAFDGLDVMRSETDATRLSGWFADQSALHGVIRQLGDLGLELCSIRRLPDQP